MFDAPPIFKSFGDVQTDVSTTVPYEAGQIVFATFVGANPRVSHCYFCPLVATMS